MIARPTSRELAEIEEVATALAAEAGQIVLGYYRQALAVEFKDRDRRDPVTAADRAVEQHLGESLRERFPSHALLGEEGAPGDPAAEYLWVVDPLDGTTNFVNRLPLFAVSIGVLQRGWPVAAAIFLPGPPDLGGGVYHARQGGGAYRGAERIAAVAAPQPEPSRLVALPGFSEGKFRLSADLSRAAGDPRTLGTVAGELALTASGTLQYALFRAPRIWDVAAGVLLVLEAGGAVYQWRGLVRGWAPLVRFEPRRPTPEDPTGLRRWSEALLVGGAGAAEAAAHGARPAYSVADIVRRLVRRQWLP